MIEEGEQAPPFELPAVRDGETGLVATDEFFGEELVILAFYPGDFNPACDGTETGLDDLDLFTMQKDVTVLAISGDSIHSHQAFAEQYTLQMPLLTDSDGSVAAAYGVRVDEDSAGYLTKRAVVVVDHTETVQYAWSSDEPAAVPNVESIRHAVEGVGDDETAQSRYRVGHAHYMEGRRAFTSAMKGYENREWMMAQTDFEQAADEFDEAGDEFNTAVRFAESDDTRVYYERAEKKAEALWRAADWLSQSASAFASGEGAKADSLRSDAEAPLETARDLHDPVEPDEFPPDEDPAAAEDDEPDHFVPDDDEEVDTSLDAELDDVEEELAGNQGSDADETPQAVGECESGATEAGAATDVSDRDPSTPASETTPAGGSSGADSEKRTGETTSGETAASEPAHSEPDSESPSDSTEREAAASGTQIDDEELEEITAELEEQSEAAEKSATEAETETADEEDVIRNEIESDPDPDGATSATTDESEQPGEDSADAGEESTAGELDEGEVELDLTDPSEGDDTEIADEDGDDESDDEDDLSGNHGVPDSL